MKMEVLCRNFNGQRILVLVALTCLTFHIVLS